MRDEKFSDQELISYLDGERDLTRYDEIRDALEESDELKKRLESLRLDTRAIAEAFNTLSAKQTPPALLNTNMDSSPRGVQIASVGAMLFVLGALLGWYAAPAPISGWKDYVAAYQALYTNSTLSHSIRSDAFKQKELKRVTAAIGKSVKLAKLKLAKELDYKRAQILGYQGSALVQLAFLTSTGQPMALCIIRTKHTNHRDIEVRRLENMSSANWRSGGYAYLLIGGNDDLMVQRIAEQFKRADL